MKSKTAFDVSFMFDERKDLKVIDLSSLNLTEVKDMSSMFYDCTNLEKVIFPSYRINSAEIIAGLFSGCTSLKKIDLSMIDTSKITSFEEIFSGCSALEEIDMSGWDLTRGEEFGAIFEGCINLRTVKLYGCNEKTIKILKRAVYENLYFTGYEYPFHHPVFKYDSIEEAPIDKLQLTHRGGPVADEPLLQNAGPYSWANIAAYHGCIDLTEGLPAEGNCTRLIVRYPVFGRIGDILCFDYAETFAGEPVHFIKCRLKHIAYMTENKAIVDVEVLEAGDICTFVSKTDIHDIDPDLYRYRLPEGDSKKPFIECISTRPMIHKLRNSYGGGDVTYVDYILTDNEGIDHLIKSEYRDFHISESFFGDKPLGFHKNAFWAQNQ